MLRKIECFCFADFLATLQEHSRVCWSLLQQSPLLRSPASASEAIFDERSECWLVGACFVGRCEMAKSIFTEI